MLAENGGNGGCTLIQDTSAVRPQDKNQRIVFQWKKLMVFDFEHV